MSSQRPTSPTVAVIGAGVSGLQALRSLKARQLDVVCFDAEAGCGGQWFENYSSLHLQVPKEMYEFFDCANDKVKWGRLPSCGQVRQECDEFAERFGLKANIKNSTEVLSIARGETKLWKLTFREVSFYQRATHPGFRPYFKPIGEEQQQEFDYVVVATGPFSHRVPFIPMVPGMQAFKGEILHSSTNLKPNRENGKRVVVVGSAKSANDQAVQACNNGASSVIQVMRRAHWCAPQWVLGVIPFEYFFCSRFGEGLVHTHQGSCAPPAPWGIGRRILNFFIKPIAWGMMKSFELLFMWQLSLHGAMRPKVDIIKDFGAGYGSCNTQGHAELRRQKRIVPKLGEIVSYTDTGVNVREGNQERFYECDLVIYGTGYTKKYDVFAEDVRAKLGDTSKGLSLYRQILHPELPQLAFVGCEYTTITNLVAAGLQAEWVARWIAGDQGEAFLASQAAMWAEIEVRNRWQTQFEAAMHTKATDLQQINYGDTLLIDMGERRYRKFPNVFAEFMMPYRSADYNGLVGGPLRNRRDGRHRSVLPVK